MQTTVRFILVLVVIISMIALWHTNPTNFDPDCQGQMVPKHCVQ